MLIGKFKIDKKNRFQMPSVLLKARDLDDCDSIELHLDENCKNNEFKIRLVKEVKKKPIKKSVKGEPNSRLALKVSDGPIHITGPNGYGLRINENNFKEIFNKCL